MRVFLDYLKMFQEGVFLNVCLRAKLIDKNYNYFFFGKILYEN